MLSVNIFPIKIVLTGYVSLRRVYVVTVYIVLIDNNIAFPSSSTQSIECGEDNHSELLWLSNLLYVFTDMLSLLFLCTYVPTGGIYVFNKRLVCSYQWLVKGRVPQHLYASIP